MKTRIINSFFGILATIVVAVSLAGCSKLKAGDKFIVSTDGVEFQYEVIVSRMNYVRVIPVSGAIPSSITIPSKVNYDGDTFLVTQIGEGAFRDCLTLTSVTLPKTVSNIEASAFAGCAALKTINTPQPLSEIGDYAFEGCISLREFSLDASISKLGKGCFRGCRSLEEVEFPTSFTAIPDEAFYGCSSLEDIHCPSTVMQIGEDAFGDCINVRDIYLDSSVQSIGARAFAGCISVEAITCLTPTPPVCAADTFDGIDPDIPITVMMASVDNYLNAPCWDRFFNYHGTY
ncbi:MAG: leucine-rich repeat domain-containing protein [Bacteroidales bacterium]|nr:leucine-rich repeat domain-containing protein [Bacteroidales bacterium]